MNSNTGSAEEALIERALQSASHTRLLVARDGVRHEAEQSFTAQFGPRPAIVVADRNTFAVAGRDVAQSFERASRKSATPFIFGDDVYADERSALQLQAALAATDAIPVAVGSGTINDLTKLAAHRLDRPYMVVATAASMDGYTAYGASITARGSKQTFDCPAPRAVLADLEVIATAPRHMNASGYADLVAKIVAGADWMVADALGVEPIHAGAWETVQRHLHEWVDSPEGIAQAEHQALRRLVTGLMMSGFAMQTARSSRPASGADHQFSHLWDMQHHEHNGDFPSHGFKVGIGTLASAALYEQLLEHDFTQLNVERAVTQWPTLADMESQIEQLLDHGELAEKAREETAAKYISATDLRGQLERLSQLWPDLRPRLVKQLLPVGRLRDMLAAAGSPSEPEQIGISRSRLRTSYWQALFIRRRFTVLDLAHRTARLEPALDRVFGTGGLWPIPGSASSPGKGPG